MKRMILILHEELLVKISKSNKIKWNLNFTSSSQASYGLFLVILRISINPRSNNLLGHVIRRLFRFTAVICCIIITVPFELKWSKPVSIRLIVQFFLRNLT